MTQLEVSYGYRTAPGNAEIRALDGVRAVYGIRRVSFNPQDMIVKVEFDASRLKEPVIASLLREAGVDIFAR